MRIVLVSGYVFPDGGAGGTRLLVAAHALVDAGHEVVVVSTRQSGAPAVDRADRFRWCSTSGVAQRLRGGWRVDLASHLHRLLTRLDRDAALTAVWVVTRDPWTLRCARRSGRRLGVPVVHELTEYPDITDARGVWARVSTRWLIAELRRLDGLMVISRALQQLAVQQGATRVLLTGPMVPPLEPLTPEPDRGTIRIGYAGAVHQAKDGVLDLLDAVALVHRRRPSVPLQLVVVGGGPDLGAVTSRAARLGLTEVLQLVGPVPTAQVGPLLRSCHVLTLPRPDSHQARGGFPTKLGEYLATGRPVVATTTGDVDRYLRDRVSGYLVPPGDPETLADALTAVLDDPTTAALVGHRGRELCTSTFAAATRVRELTAFLETAVRRGPDPRPVVVQHSFGVPGQGGPATALARLEASDLATRYRFVAMTQQGASGRVDLRRIWRWSREVRRQGADLVHVRGLGNEGFHGAVAGRLGGARRVLVSIHGSVRDVRRPPRRLRALVVAHLLEPVTLLLSTDVVTMCQAMSDRRFLKPFRGRLRGVVPNGVEPAPSDPELRDQVRTELGLSPADVVGVVVGRLSVEKGHLVLAAALSGRGPAPLTLLVVGDGPDRAEIEAAYATADVRVVFVGQQPDVAPFLAAADVFVFPTLHENLSNALIEAMAAGMPVVASAVGGNVEVLGHGGGLLVPAGEPAALREALDRVARDPELRADLGRAARATVDQHYSLAHMVAGWDRVYGDLVGR